MAYPQEVMVGAVLPKTTAVFTAENLASAAGDYGQFIVMKPIKVTRLEFMVTVAVAASTTAPVVTIYRRPTAGSNAGRVAIGTLTIPNGATVGQVYYKDVNPVTLNAGEEICFSRTTQAADAVSAAGGGYYGFMAELKTESPANGANMVASA